MKQNIPTHHENNSQPHDKSRKIFDYTSTSYYTSN